MPRDEFIYRLTLLTVDTTQEEAEFYFTSLSAIYDRFTPEQIGCRVTRLYSVGVTRGAVYRNKLVEVRRYPLARKPQRRAVAD